MIGSVMMINGKLADPAGAIFSLDDVDITYGYGCYETLKVREGTLYFPEFHEERLLRSAEILGIAHTIASGDVVAALRALVHAETVDTCNIKILLTGHEGRPADWYAFLLPPVLPPATVYEQGVSCLLFRGERHFPAAKSLSMLLSTVAYRCATMRGCYDALLVNGRGEITEGTRTNIFYARRGVFDAVFTPPATDVLAGITRRTLMAALAEAGVRTIERPLTLDDALGGGFALAVTSTSSRVIPVRSLAGTEGPEGMPVPVLSPVGDALAGSVFESGVSPELARFGAVYDGWLERYARHDLRPGGQSNML
jgi:branched-subunit amino acid aminotransferase/4-amino-4-deoxychorismate lyase